VNLIAKVISLTSTPTMKAAIMIGNRKTAFDCVIAFLALVLVFEIPDSGINHRKYLNRAILKVPWF